MCECSKAVTGKHLRQYKGSLKTEAQIRDVAVYLEDSGVVECSVTQYHAQHVRARFFVDWHMAQLHSSITHPLLQIKAV
jgi:hypothetical protein